MSASPVITGARAARSLILAIMTAVGLLLGFCLLPDDAYLRWQSSEHVNDGLFSTLAWTYERIHFDPRAVDIAILGPSKTMLGLSADRIQRALREENSDMTVANFSVTATGRNVEVAILKELYRVKTPKILIIEVDDTLPYWGHPAFKYVATASDILAPPAFLLHNQLKDLAFLPRRQAMILAARFAPDLFGLHSKFSDSNYHQKKYDFSEGKWLFEGKLTDMDAKVSGAALLVAAPPPSRMTLADRILLACCNDGDEKVYLRQIEALAAEHGSQLIFVQMPSFHGPGRPEGAEYFEAHGRLLTADDFVGLRENESLFQSASHLNHDGAMFASDTLAAFVKRAAATSGKRT